MTPEEAQSQGFVHMPVNQLEHLIENWYEFSRAHTAPFKAFTVPGFVVRAQQAVFDATGRVYNESRNEFCYVGENN